MNRAQYPHLTDQQYRDNKKFLQKLHIANGDLDEDTYDSEAMAERYKEEEVDQQQHEYDLDVAKTDASFRYN